MTRIPLHLIGLSGHDMVLEKDSVLTRQHRNWGKKAPDSHETGFEALNITWRKAVHYQDNLHVRC